MDVLINIDVPDLAAAIAFYGDAFGLVATRRLGSAAVELSGWSAPVYLLSRPDGSIGAGQDRRRYDRRWTPVHLDLVVDDLDSALTRALRAGARQETGIRSEAYGRIVGLADPFGHGFCLIQFTGRGYDEITQ